MQYSIKYPPPGVLNVLFDPLQSIRCCHGWNDLKLQCFQWYQSRSTKVVKMYTQSIRSVQYKHVHMQHMVPKGIEVEYGAREVSVYVLIHVS